MGTVGKALELLEHFTPATPQLGLSQLARLAGLSKATCHRLLTDLAAQGLVEQTDPGRDYRIGPAVLRLAALREATVPLRESALPILRRLADTTGETAHLSQLAAGRLVTLAYAYAARPGMKVMMEDAAVLPFHATASGAAVLAHLSDAEPLIAAAPDPIALRNRIAETHSRGLAETVSTFEKDVHSLAVPLFDARGACCGALAIAAAAPRMTPDLHATISRELPRAAALLSGLMGGRLPDTLARRRTVPSPERTPP